MKQFLNAILVVEGKEDASYLSNYIASEIVTVNGYELSEANISYLKDKKVIILTDPDQAGKDIRKKLNELLNDTINIEVDINKCNRGKKNGIAECEIDEILATLKPYVIDRKETNSNIDSYALYELGILGNKELRKYVCGKLKLGDCNNRQLVKRINYQCIKLDALKSIVEEYKNGN